jgi:PKD repeat protein
VRFSGGLAGVTAAVLIIGGAAIPAARAGEVAAGRDAAATPGTTLYVDFNGPCSDSGPGTLANPFCTVQAAANVVDPGQTVDIIAASTNVDPQSLTIARSGTPTEPITFTWPGTGPEPLLSPTKQTGKGVITFQDVHDVTLSRLDIASIGTDDGIDVIGSSDISLANLAFSHGADSPTAAPASDDVMIDGTSSDVTVSRTFFRTGTPLNAVLAEPGAQQVTLTTNVVYGPASGFTLEGATGAVVTSNTIAVVCTSGTAAHNAVALADGSSGSVENNVIEPLAEPDCAAAAAGLSVDASSAGSAGGVTADYNAFYSEGPATDYSWAGTSYPDPAAFAAATGQGADDITLAKAFITDPPEGSSAINSANCSAPGELSTDVDGNPWVLDPQAADADLGNGSCYASRGAYAPQDSMPVTYTAPPLDSSGYQAGVVPYTYGVTVTSAATSAWGEPVSYTIDFGDGSSPSPAVPGTAITHQYTTPGQYPVTITAADTSGSTDSATLAPVYALPVQPLAIGLSAVQAGEDAADFTFSPANLGTDDAENRGGQVASIVFACGGASTQSLLPAGQGNTQCVYTTPGTYTATLTVTDVLGRTSTAQATITVGSEWPLHLSPTDIYNHEAAAARGLLGVTASGEAAAGHSATATATATVAAAGEDGAICLYNYDSGFRPVTVNVGLAGSYYAYP